MESIRTLYVTGYRSFEMGIFRENDPKIKIIKNVLRQEITDYANNGLEWVLVSGNLGTELWAAEVVSEMKKEYPSLRLGIIYPFKEFGQQWNERNKETLRKIEELADYINMVSKHPYQSPIQLKNHTKFILAHTGATMMIYDPEYFGKTHYFLEEALMVSETSSYEIRMISMDDLQNSISESEYN